MDPSQKSICSETGLSRPECSCPRCFEQQLRQFHPAFLDGAEPEIRITRTSTAPERRARPAPPG